MPESGRRAGTCFPKFVHFYSTAHSVTIAIEDIDPDQEWLKPGGGGDHDVAKKKREITIGKPSRIPEIELGGGGRCGPELMHGRKRRER